VSDKLVKERKTYSGNLEQRCREFVAGRGGRRGPVIGSRNTLFPLLAFLHDSELTSALRIMNEVNIASKL